MCCRLAFTSSVASPLHFSPAVLPPVSATLPACDMAADRPASEFNEYHYSLPLSLSLSISCFIFNHVHPRPKQTLPTFQLSSSQVLKSSLNERAAFFQLEPSD